MSDKASRIRRWVTVALMSASAATTSVTGVVAAEEPALPVELNKLESLTGGASGCRVYFLVSNPDAEAFDQLRLDLILFGNDGVIARRIALDLAPLAPKKTAVRLFDLAGLNCDDIGKMLVNDVISCVHKGSPAADADRTTCLDRLALTTKTKAAVSK